MIADIQRQIAAAKAGNSPRIAPAPSPKGKTQPAVVGERTTQEIAFNCVVPGNNGKGGLLRAHWTERGRLLGQYEWMVTAARLRPMAGPIRLELVRYSIGPQMDFDNLVSTGKLLVDALVRCQILEDDKPAVIAQRDYRQAKAPGKDCQRTIIRLIPL
jgi:hypothetical protein